MILGRKKIFVLLVLGLCLTACTSQERLNEDFVQAAMKGDIKRLNYCLTKGADIESTDLKYGATSLMWAAHEGHTDILHRLLEKGAQINSQQKLGRTALWYAAQQDKLEAAKILISHGADLDIASHDGKTPFDIATELGHIELAGLLKQARAGY
jgi:ankyrin repeat protein